jgi:hypothetical protein
MKQLHAAVALFVAFLIAGCGTTHHAPVAPAACAHRESMGCVLSKLPPPKITATITPAAAYGVDFGWGSINPARAQSMRLRFVASYLSNDPGKNFTAATIKAFHAAGIATVDVWESTADRATQGFAAGVSDATRARALALELGNKTRPILFAVDCDCTDAAILPYFRGLDVVLPGRVDAYGGYSQVLFLHSEGVVGSENWQTYAWSGGKWLPATIAPLEQYLNGSVFDYDRAITVPYGEFPWSPPKPPPPPVHTTTTPPPPPPVPPTTRAVCFGPHARGSQTCARVIARWAWLVDRRSTWRAAFRRCSRRAAPLTCGYAWRWVSLRAQQVRHLRRRFS